MTESLERFREGLSPVRQLVGGASSRAELVRKFVTALSANDTAAFRAMTLSRAEFAWLFYPEHPFVGPPYELDAETMWLQQSANSGKGLARLLERYGGQELHYVSHACDKAPERQGSNLVWKSCTVVMANRYTRVEGSFFGDVLERDGRFEFVSYANQL